MKKLVELLLDDTSDKETFRFQVGCDNCRKAYLSAVAQLAERFDYSPIRKQVVCDDCFLICEDMDMCRGCAERLQEMGVSVLANVSNRG